MLRKRGSPSESHSVYIYKGTKHPDEAKKFVAFIASTKGCDIRSAANGATGPYLIKGCGLPDSVPQAVKDLLPYFQEGGNSAPALEYLSPVKGPSLEQITVEVGSGIRSAADGAALTTRTSRSRRSNLAAGWNNARAS
jgi:raffinose/stachyose/melibiose transport system substrate-binding protein